MYNVLDLRSINWTKSVNNSGTDGCYMKTKIQEKGRVHYLKLSNFNPYSGFIGFESVNEVIASRLGKILGFHVLNQTLRKVKIQIDNVEYITFACDSESYKGKNQQRLTAGEFYKVYKQGRETPVETFKRCGFSDFVDMTFVFDFIIIGRDRHDSNIEYLRQDGYLKPAPLFDNGISLLAPITIDMPINQFYNMVTSFRELDDYTANNFIGYKSLHSNLSLISKPVKVNRLKKEHKKSIFYNLSEVLPDYYKDKLWNIICYRYAYLRKQGIIVEV